MQTEKELVSFLKEYRRKLKIPKTHTCDYAINNEDDNKILRSLDMRSEIKEKEIDYAVYEWKGHVYVVDGLYDTPLKKFQGDWQTALFNIITKQIKN